MEPERRSRVRRSRRAGRAELRRPVACIAVDWSGALATVRSRMWLAESREKRLVRIERGFDRAEVIRHLIECAAREPRLVVGLDFAFSFPRWFLDERGLASARELWERVARDGEQWLASCPPPFWGKPCVPRPPPVDGRSEWRVTEHANLLVGGIGPKSIFQIGGAGTVGTGSLRGMPYLRELQDAGFSIWPFDPPRLPMAVEIYPRYLTGRVEKSNAVARSLYLQARLARESKTLLALAASTEDSFDAAVSAACMQRFASDFTRLARSRRTPIDRLEGRIWTPLRDPTFERW
jgi:hypothetical protein